MRYEQCQTRVFLFHSACSAHNLALIIALTTSGYFFVLFVVFYTTEYIFDDVITQFWGQIHCFRCLLKMKALWSNCCLEVTYVKHAQLKASIYRSPLSHLGVKCVAQGHIEFLVIEVQSYIYFMATLPIQIKVSKCQTSGSRLIPPSGNISPLV